MREVFGLLLKTTLLDTAQSKMSVNNKTNMIYGLYISKMCIHVRAVLASEWQCGLSSVLYGMDCENKRSSEITLAKRIPVNSWERTSRCSEKIVCQEKPSSTVFSKHRLYTYFCSQPGDIKYKSLRCVSLSTCLTSTSAFPSLKTH